MKTKMSRHKRGEFDPLKVIAGAVLILLILVILLVILGKFFPGIINLRNCPLNGGRCAERSIGCAENEFVQQGFGGCSESQVCCKPYEELPPEAQDIFTDKERDALVNAIIFTLNKDPKQIEDRALVPLKVDFAYTFHIKINDKLKSAFTDNKLGKCAVYVTDSLEAGKRYYFKDGKLEPSTSDDLTDKELFNCKPGEEIAIPKVTTNDVSSTYTPFLSDVYKGLMLNIILFDKETKEIADKTTLTDGDKAELQAMYTNTQHWLASRTYRLNVEPVVKISGLSGSWVAKDDLTLSCSDVTCIKFGVALVKLDNNNYEAMIDECKDKTKNAGFAYKLDYIAGTDIKTTGIPLNIDFGGFRLPSQQKVVYQTLSKPIAVADNKAQILIDKATMINTFYKKTQNSALFTGDSTYLCVEATLEGGKTIVHALSKTPLRVDILPPYIDAEKGIKVIYPDLIRDIIPHDMGGTGSYYYKEYPRVVITGCYDYGQSGCSNYDYYIHTGNFVSLSSITADWETGVKALLLTEGLNILFRALSAEDPLNTICPYMYSGSYRLNTRPEIRFPYEGQGMMCIKAADKVGNKELYWKELWTPEQMFKEIASNVSSEIIS
jgi:hypothetical protein